MTVKEFIEVVNYTVIHYAKIYEMCWDKLYKDYNCNYTGNRVHSKEDLRLYLDCELDGFELELCYGEYDDSAIYIKMPKPIYKNGEMIRCPCCGGTIIVESNNVKCHVCGWTAD